MQHHVYAGAEPFDWLIFFLVVSCIGLYVWSERRVRQHRAGEREKEIRLSLKDNGYTSSAVSDYDLSEAEDGACVRYTVSRAYGSETFDVLFIPGRGWNIVVFDKHGLEARVMDPSVFVERVIRLGHVRDEQREAVVDFIAEAP